MRRPILPAPNALDRIIASVAPGIGARRLLDRARYEAMAGAGGGYIGARKDRRATKAWRPSGGAADADTIPDLPSLRERSRDLARNTPIALAAINRTVTNVVGSGLVAQPRIDREILRLDEDAADEWERAADREFRLWAGSVNCDATRIQNFYDLQDLAFRSVLESGDLFIAKRQIARDGWPYGLALHFIEADQVGNPDGTRDGMAGSAGKRIVGGIEIDDNGAPVAVHLQKEHPGNIAGTAAREWARVPIWSGTGRRQILHLYHRRRIGLTRGVPMLAPVIEALKQLGTYAEAELMAAVIGAMVVVVFKSGGGENLPNVNPTEETGATAADRDYRMAAGTVLEIEHSDQAEVPNVGRPNKDFDPFFVAIVRQIGAALEIPFEVLIQHFTASYSASRAALEMAWQAFRRSRAWLAGTLCREAYEDVIAEAVTLGRLSAPGFFGDPLIRAAWLGVEWVGPGRISLDPLRENNADKIAQEESWKTGAQITAEKTGGDWEANHEQRAKEKRMRRRDGLEPGAAPASDPAPPVPPADEAQRRDEE